MISDRNIKFIVWNLFSDEYENSFSVYGILTVATATLTRLREIITF